MKHAKKYQLLILPILILSGMITWIVTIFWIFKRPSNEREWEPYQAVLPSADIKGNRVHLKSVRNFEWVTEKKYIPSYYDKRIDLKNLESLWFILSPFSKWKGPAHTFLSFGFKGGYYVSISVEIRRRKGQEYSPFKGLFRQYEIMYVVADERDIIRLRTNVRKDDVFVYPVDTTPRRMKTLFLNMLKKVNELKNRPEFYNTLTSSCSTNIALHANEVTPNRIPLNYKVLLPAFSDELAYNLGLIDTSLTFKAARERFRVTKRAQKYGNDPKFSVKIRQEN